MVEQVRFSVRHARVSRVLAAPAVVILLTTVAAAQEAPAAPRAHVPAILKITDNLLPDVRVITLDDAQKQAQVARADCPRDLRKDRTQSEPRRATGAATGLDGARTRRPGRPAIAPVARPAPSTTPGQQTLGPLRTA